MQTTLGGAPGFNIGSATGGNNAFGVFLSAGFGANRNNVSGRGYSVFDWIIDKIAPCPWSATVGSSAPVYHPHAQPRQPLYTPEQRVKRDSTRWTFVQGVLAPVQFLIFAISLTLVLRYLATGSGYQIAAASVVVKTAALYLIMITGCIWEKEVFDKYLFAPAFFWEDVFSMLVLALHTAYLIALFSGRGSARQLMLLAVAAYASYVINASQFILKLRAARLDKSEDYSPSLVAGCPK